MTATTPDETISRSVMFLCMGAALAILIVHGFTPKATSSMNPVQRKTATSSTSPTAPANGTELIVDLSDRQVYVQKHQQVVAKYPLAVGQDGWETPSGKFQVMRMQRNPKWIHPITGEVVPAGPNNPLGDRWIGFWTDGKSEIGFHGTNEEDLIGQAVSHGCLRMYNRDIDALYDQVAMGTPVIVRP